MANSAARERPHNMRRNRIQRVQLRQLPKKKKNKIVKFIGPALPPKMKKKRMNRRIFPVLGQAIGNATFGPVGGKIGRVIGNYVNKITGSGDYKINSNTLLNGQVPVFETNARETIIAHREYLQDIVGTTNFTIQSWPINPGMPATFPWLAQVAVNFEQYEMLGLIFEYRPLSGPSLAGANTAMGAVIMATDYDAEHPLFTSKQQMESYEFSCADVPFNKIIHGVECSKQDKPLNIQYIRTGALQPGDDLQFYDLGNFQLATQGMQAGVTVIGELWVSYHVRLLKPRLPVPFASTNKYAHILELPGGSASSASPLGTTGGGVSLSSNINVLPVTTNYFTLSDLGTYSISYNATNGAVAITTSIVFTFGANFVAYNGYHAGNGYSSINGAAITTVMTTALVTVTAAGTGAANRVTISGATGLLNGNCDLLITRLPDVPTVTF